MSQNHQKKQNSSMSLHEDIAKKKLMVKYNLSKSEADEIIKKFKQKRQNNLQNNDSKKNANTNNSFPSEDYFKTQFEDSSYDPIKNKGNVANHNFKLINQTQDENKFNNMQQADVSFNTQKHVKDVDNILSDILPDYNKQISIELTNVNLTFEIVHDKIDTIKESIIRTLKRNKSKKIKLHALKNISFKIYKGEKVGIVGYNGAGKSTLLNVICGIYPPDNGQVITNGKISPLLSLGAGFDPNYSGRKNIFFNGAVLGYDREYLESKVNGIIEFSELGDFIDYPIKNYSSGMLAKLSFSIATAVEPDILIIDEILGVGDVNFQKKSRDKIKSLMDGGTTVLFVSHSIPQVRELCDKAIWIDHGEVKEVGEVNKVCDNYLKDAEKASNEKIANIQFR